MTYRNTVTGEVRELDPALIAAWDATGNPKRLQWEPFTPPPPDPEPVVPRWVEFGATLAADVPVNEWFRALFPQAPVLHGMLTVGLGQAAQGDPRTFLVAWAQAVAVDLVPLKLAESVAAMATSFDLPAEFVAALTAPP